MKFAKLCFAAMAALLLAGCQGADVLEDLHVQNNAGQANEAKNEEPLQKAAVSGSGMLNGRTSQDDAQQKEDGKENMAQKETNAQNKEDGRESRAQQEMRAQKKTEKNTDSKGNKLQKEIRTEGWRIQKECIRITEPVAEEIYQEVLGLQQELKEGIETVANSRMVFLTEEKQPDQTVIVRAVFEADYTGIRNPKDHPMIQGMYEAFRELESEEQKQAAEAYIQGHLMELYPHFQETCRISTQVAIKFEESHAQAYSLYYPYVENSAEYLQPFRQYAMAHWKEDAKAARQLGRKIVLENVKS